MRVPRRPDPLWLCPLLLTACSIAESPPEPRPLFVAQISNVQVSLRGVCAVGTRVAWASGEKGTWLRTVNGGMTWHAAVVPGAEELDFRDVHALDAKRAWLLSAGSPARIYYTEDAGQNWKLQHDDAREEVFLDAMAFWDDRSAIVFGDPLDGNFSVLRTDDGGQSWKTVESSLPAPEPGEAGFAASGTCVAVAAGTHAWIGTGGGPNARVLRTADGGKTWTTATAPVIAGGASRGVFSLAFADAMRGVMVGGDYREPASKGGNAAWTDDGGATWTLAAEPPGGYRSCVAWIRDWADLDRPTCCAVGPTGIDLSTDGGDTWFRVTREGFHAVSFTPGGSHGWAVGAGGRIARWLVDRAPR